MMKKFIHSYICVVIISLRLDNFLCSFIRVNFLTGLFMYKPASTPQWLLELPLFYLIVMKVIIGEHCCKKPTLPFSPINPRSLKNGVSCINLKIITYRMLQVNKKTFSYQDTRINFSQYEAHCLSMHFVIS